MGNSINKDSYYMHIKIIGSNMEKFYDEFNKSIYLRNIIKYWTIDKLKKSDIMKQINYYFDYYLEDIIENEEDEAINLREVLILKVNNVLDPVINILLEKMNKISETYYMPLVLLLTIENSKQKFEIDEEKYQDIDPRLIFVTNYTENPERMEDEIYPILLRFCSIHNELGDIFSVDEGDRGEYYDLIEKNFPFNLNIACMGRFGQGKSTAVNILLQEYKAKESSKGSSQTKNLTFYQVKNYPIRILDIPGFENEKTVQNTIEKLKICGEKMNKIKDNLHIILYFLNFSEKRAFMKIEYPIIEEITKHKDSKIIYVITHSSSNMTDKIKKKIFERINSGIQGITKNTEISDKIGMFKAYDENVVFVNFHKNVLFNEKPFGKKELFKKIYDIFIQSEDFKNSLKDLNKNIIEQNVLKLRKEANEALLSNKIWGVIVGLIPFIDWAIQKFVIKKNAIKKVSEIFGINAQFIDEDNAKIKKNLLKESKAKNMNIFLKDCYHISEDTTVTSKAVDFSSVQATVAAQKAAPATETAAAGSSTLGKFDRYSFPVYVTIPGVGFGGYITHTFCEELLDKFVDYYKNNADKIINSYKIAADYFLLKNENL